MVTEGHHDRAQARQVGALDQDPGQVHMAAVDTVEHPDRDGGATSPLQVTWRQV
jgi:hypothetical protein